MKKHLFKFFMLALSLLLSIPIARAADQTTIEGITLTEKWNFSRQRGNFSSSGWLEADSRDLAFWNGELIALTKSGKLSRVKVATGAKIGDISTNGISGGTLKLTSIVSVKGKLYGCNLGGDKDTNKFKIYRWDNVNSDPVLVYEGTTPNTTALGRKMGVHNNHLMLTNGGSHLYRIPVNDDGSLGAVITETYPEAGKIKISGDGSAIAIASVESTNRARFIMSAPYGTDVVKVKAEGGGGVGNIGIDGQAFVCLNRVPAMQVINFKDKKILAAIDYTTANSFKCPVLKFLVKTGDLKYTNNGNQLPAQALETAGSYHNADNVAAVEYQIRDNGETLDVVFLVPNLGAAMFSTKIKDDPVAATDLKVSQVWNGDHQEATFTWTPGSDIDHYTLVRAKSAEDTEVTNISTNIKGTAKNFKYNPVQTGLGYQPLYILTSYDSNGAVVGNRCYVRQWDIDFGGLPLTATVDENKTATLNWTAPANGIVNQYRVIRRKNIVKDGKVTVDEITEATLPAGTTTCTVSNYEIITSQADGSQVSTSLYVIADMAQTITTTVDEKRNTVTSNTVKPAVEGMPVITEIRTSPGRTTAQVLWEFSTSKHVEYYEVFRDGICILPTYEAAKFSDMNLPDGTHSYYVIAHTADGQTFKSNTETCVIARNRLVTGYGLQEIYNYPIVAADASVSGDEYVKTTGVFANGRMGMNTGGAPGDIYRQAQFHNGKWYLACVTTQTKKTGTNDNCDYITYRDENNDNTATGGYYVIDAQNPRDISKWQYNQKWLPLENQSIAISDDGVIFWKKSDATSAPVGQYNWYLSPIKYLAGSNGKSIDLTGQNWYTLTENQYYRTHYLSFAGNSSNGKILSAMNYSRDLYAIAPNGTLTKYTAPTPAGATTSTSTENYAFPIVGHNGNFIHQVRNEAIYYVNASNGAYTKIYDKPTDTGNTGGVAFEYNDELFLLHPTSLRSNNIGHFSIDIASHKAFDEMIPVAAFQQQKKADFEAGNSNANWFGAEYNAEEDCIYIYQYVPGVRFAKYRFYKYLDFPGVQPKLDIQVVESPKANGSGDEVELLTAVATWQRPNETPVKEGGDGYRPDLDATEYLIGEYEVEFLDNNNAPYSGNNWSKQLYAGETGGQYNGGDAKDKDFNQSIYHGYYGKDEKGNTTQKNLKEVSHTVRVTPIYHKKSNWNVTVRGEGNIAIARADYPAGINPLEVHAYDGTKNGLGYRVDFNFDRASMEEGQYPHHVSFFTLEVSKDGGKTFDKLTDYYFIWGNGYHSPSNENFEHVYDNYGRDFNDVVRKDGAKSYIVDLIPGDYRFGNNLGEENLKDRYYYQKLNGTNNANALNKTFTAPDGTEMKECYKGYAAPDAKGECVAYYYTNENPKNYLYRAVAHYAAGNETIHKEAYTTAVAPLDMTTTGVDNIAGDNEGNLSIYPVPAESTVTINAPVGISNVKVFSLSGSLVLDVNGEGNNTQTIDVSMLTPGVYMVAVNSLTPVRMIKR